MTTYIDIKKEIKNSNSTILKKLPGFIVNLLVKLVRQDEINSLLAKYENLDTRQFLRALIIELNITVVVEGLENLPENNKCFFIANHPFGLADGLVLTDIVSGKYGEFRSIGNDLFLLIPQLRPSIAAVNVFQSNQRDYVLELEKVFHSSLPITHFPAGVVSRVKNWKVQDFEWQKSLISKAITSNREIVPFFFFGKNSLLFYSVYMVRKMFGISTNLELILLPHELFNKRNKTIKVKIGKVIPPTVFDKSKTLFEWAQWVRVQVYNLRLN